MIPLGVNDLEIMIAAGIAIKSLILFFSVIEMLIGFFYFSFLKHFGVDIAVL